MGDPLVIAGKTFESRLLLGTGKWTSTEVMVQALRASGTEMVTVAVRRVDLQDRSGESILGALVKEGYDILPNTAGCYNCEEAVRYARLGREAVGTDWVKLEVIGDQKTL
ncbi:MAG: thiazole synthase, partial [Candidatus Omnitrophica bacterium]|nr:thiazole synthase [Candidatus Omnitrophota bacterium]